MMTFFFLAYFVYLSHLPCLFLATPLRPHVYNLQPASQIITPTRILYVYENTPNLTVS